MFKKSHDRNAGNDVIAVAVVSITSIYIYQMYHRKKITSFDIDHKSVVLFGRPTGGRHPKRSGVGLVVPWTNEVDLLLMQQKLKKGPGHGEIHAATVVDFCSRMVQNYCLRETIYCCCCCCCCYCCYCCYCLLFLFFCYYCSCCCCCFSSSSCCCCFSCFFVYWLLTI